MLALKRNYFCCLFWYFLHLSLCIGPLVENHCIRQKYKHVMLQYASNYIPLQRWGVLCMASCDNLCRTMKGRAWPQCACCHPNKKQVKCEVKKITAGEWREISWRSCINALYMAWPEPHRDMGWPELRAPPSLTFPWNVLLLR